MMIFPELPTKGGGGSSSMKSNLIRHRAPHRSGFTIITNEAIQDISISLKAKGLLHYILSLPEDWNISINGLSVCLKESETAIRSAIKELEAAGYLYRTQIPPSKSATHRIEYSYEVFEHPLHTENLHAEDQDAGDQHTEELQADNPTQISNKDKGITTKALLTKNKEHTVPESFKQEFETLWERYPKKRGRDIAYKSFIKARTDGTSFEEIEQGLTLYIQQPECQGSEDRYIKEGGRWFAEHRWKDDYPKNRSYGAADAFKNYSRHNWDYEELEKLAVAKAFSDVRSTAS